MRSLGSFYNYVAVDGKCKRERYLVLWLYVLQIPPPLPRIRTRQHGDVQGDGVLHFVTNNVGKFVGVFFLHVEHKCIMNLQAGEASERLIQLSHDGSEAGHGYFETTLSTRLDLMVAR